MSEKPEGKGRRRPTMQDVEPVLEEMSDGISLREASAKFGIHPGHMHALLHSTDELRAQYVRACAMRADFQQEQMNSVAIAAATGGEVTINGVPTRVDPSGARVLLDTLKWTAARMDPKTVPMQRVQVGYEHLERMTPAERQARLKEIEAELAAAPAEEPAED